MWRNGRRNGLKIAVLPISRPFTPHQIADVLPGKSEQNCDLATLTLREQKGRHSSTAKRLENVRVPSTGRFSTSRTYKATRDRNATPRHART
jgi:hypothetical protein